MLGVVKAIYFYKQLSLRSVLLLGSSNPFAERPLICAANRWTSRLRSGARCLPLSNSAFSGVGCLQPIVSVTESPNTYEKGLGKRIFYHAAIKVHKF
jgi:hypothetical protein